MTEDHKVRCSIHLLGAFFFQQPPSFAFFAPHLTKTLLEEKEEWRTISLCGTPVFPVADTVNAFVMCNKARSTCRVEKDEDMTRFGTLRMEWPKKPVSCQMEMGTCPLLLQSQQTHSCVGSPENE